MQRSPLIPIFLIVFVDVLGLTIILPMFPFYAEKFGASVLQVGMLVSSYALCQFLAGPVLGQLSDRYGRKPVLFLSQLGTFVGFLILAFASSLWMLFLGRIIDGITAGNLTVAQAAIADVTEPQNRIRAFGIIGVSFGLGFLIGPAISGFLVSYGMNAPIFAAAALSFLSILGTFFLLPKAPPVQQAVMEKGFFVSKKTWKRFLSHAVIGRLLLQFFFFSFIFASFSSGFALFSERRYEWHGVRFGPREVGYVLALLGVFGILLQGGLVARLAKKIGESKMVSLGFLCCVIGYIILGWAFDLQLLSLALLFSAFGTGVLRPGLTSLLSQNVDRTEQGLVMGLSQSLASIAQIFAPLVAGFLIQHNHLEVWALVMAAMAAGALVMMRSGVRGS